MCLDEESSPVIEMTDALILFISGLTTFTWCRIFVVFTAPQMKQDRTFAKIVVFSFLSNSFSTSLFQKEQKKLVEISLKMFCFYILHKIVS